MSFFLYAGAAWKTKSCHTNLTFAVVLKKRNEWIRCGEVKMMEEKTTRERA
jgi:hypothetical protein